jgi:hypothetical protein
MTTCTGTSGPDLRPDRLVGRVARCSKGYLGVITGYAHLPWGWSYTGYRVDSPMLKWATREPHILSRLAGLFWIIWHDTNGQIRRELHRRILAP